MAERHHFPRRDGSLVEVVWTAASDGDFHIDGDRPALTERRAGIMPGAWAVARQVHGNRVVDAEESLGTLDLPEADAITTSAVGQPISVQGADCAPIAFVTNRGPIGVAHAGWRGLAGGVIAAVDERLREGNARVERAVVGPVICTDCYEFGAEDLDHVASQLGEDVRATTSSGSPALDMRAGIISAFDAIDVTTVDFVGGCSSCDGGFSHRARQDLQRHCLVAQIRPGGPDGFARGAEK